MNPSASLRVVLLLTLASVLYLIQPFATTLLLAAVIVVLAWPIHERISARLGQRRILTAFTSTALLTVLVVAPAGPLLFLVSQELGRMLSEAGAELSGTAWTTALTDLERYRPIAWLAEVSGNPTFLSDTLRRLGTDLAASTTRFLTDRVPNLLGLTAQAALDIVIFYLAVVTLFYRGPDYLTMFRRVSPLEDRHLDRLFKVFAQFARNVVFAGLVAAITQGIVASIGYVIAGVDRPLLLGALTAVLAYIPLIGTTLVWVPLALSLLSAGQQGTAIFIVVWSLGLTSTVDNVVRPILVRGRSSVPPLLIFLGVFGGLQWLGVVGILVGPMLMAMLLALLTIYAESRANGAAPPAPAEAQ